MHWRAKDPASCYSHFLGVVLSITGLATLLVESRGDPWRVVGFSIYGASLILLYSASTIYHWQELPPRGEDILKRRIRLAPRSEEHTSELQSLAYLVCRLLL